jgi:hypothetical protein
MDQLDITAAFESVYEEHPTVGSMICPDGKVVYLYQSRDKHGVRPAPPQWYPLCHLVSGEPGERVEFELYPDLIIEADPRGIVEVILVTLGVDAEKAIEASKLFFRLVEEAGWNGPTAQKPDPIKGTVYVSWEDDNEEIDSNDIRPVLAQIRDPDFSGLLVFEDDDGDTRVINLRDVRTIEVVEERS